MFRCWLPWCALLLGPTALAQVSWLPVDPGAARCTAGGNSATLENAALRRDSHWIGGDPARGDVYGWASWSPSRAVIASRNPSGHPQSLRLDLAAALELPKNAAHSWRVSTPRHSGEAKVWSAEHSAVVNLKPFEVQLWDLQSP